MTETAVKSPVLYTEVDATLLGLESYFTIRTPETTDFSGEYFTLACQTEQQTQKLARAIKRANPKADIRVYPPVPNELFINYARKKSFVGRLIEAEEYGDWNSTLVTELDYEHWEPLVRDILEEVHQGLIKGTEVTALLERIHKRVKGVSRYVLEKHWLEPLRAELEETYNSKSAVRPALPSGGNSGKEEKPSIEQQVYQALFARYCYATIADKIHKYAETHYEPVEDGEIEREIIEYLEHEFIGKERPATSQSCLNWLKKRTYVSLKKVNCGGINLKNGILDIAFDKDGELEVHLSEHNPERIFTFCSDVEYNPNADSTQLNKLLECLDEPYRTIFVRTLAASFALPEVRKRRGREVKCLIMTGTGANGKDTVMLPIKYIFGSALTKVDSIDMLRYDEGNKFGCASIVGSLINYNTEAKKVDKLQDCSFLKALVTGDDVSIERKNKDSYPYEPKCIALFSTNDEPKSRNISEAVKSRYAEIPFGKTFSNRPKPGQLKADPRFHDDPNFIKSEIAPAFINLLLRELVNLLNHGINYSATDADMDASKYIEDRIYRYFTDAGIIEVAGGKESGQYILLDAAWNIYLQALEKEGVDEDTRKRNRADYCADPHNFTKWLKNSFKGIKAGQKRIGGLKPTVIYGLTYADIELRHVDNLNTASVPAKTGAKTELRHAQTSLDSGSSVSESVLAVSEQVSELKPLPDKDCLSVLADCTELPGEWLAVYPGTKEDYRQCRVFRPSKNKRWFWCLFMGESEPQKVAPHNIEPDPNEF